MLSTAKDVVIAVRAAQMAFHQCSKVNVKTRVLKLMQKHQLMTENLDKLAEMVMKEYGKNIVEAKASVTKEIEIGGRRSIHPLFKFSFYCREEELIHVFVVVDRSTFLCRRFMAFQGA